MPKGFGRSGVSQRGPSRDGNGWGISKQPPWGEKRALLSGEKTLKGGPPQYGAHTNFGRG